MSHKLSAYTRASARILFSGDTIHILEEAVIGLLTELRIRPLRESYSPIAKDSKLKWRACQWKVADNEYLELPSDSTTSALTQGMSRAVGSQCSFGIRVDNCASSASLSRDCKTLQLDRQYTRRDNFPRLTYRISPVWRLWPLCLS